MDIYTTLAAALVLGPEAVEQMTAAQAMGGAIIRVCRADAHRPQNRALLERMGMVFPPDPDADKLLVPVALPEGWSAPPTDAPMYRYILDTRKRRRVHLGLKDVPWDRWASLQVLPRFLLRPEWAKHEHLTTTRRELIEDPIAERVYYDDRMDRDFSNPYHRYQTMHTPRRYKVVKVPGYDPRGNAEHAQLPYRRQTVVDADGTVLFTGPWITYKDWRSLPAETSCASALAAVDWLRTQGFPHFEDPSLYWEASAPTPHVEESL